MDIENIEFVNNLAAMVGMQNWAIQRVRKLHKPFQSEDGLACGICLEWIEEDFFTGYNQATYPCPTIKALDGEQ